MFFPFNIVEYLTLLSNTSTRVSCQVSTVYARNAWNHVPLLATKYEEKKNGLHFMTLAPSEAQVTKV